MNATTEKTTQKTQRSTNVTAVLFLSSANTADQPSGPHGEPLVIEQQRQAGERTAGELNISITQEFVEIGASALHSGERPILQAALVYLRQHPEVHHAIFPGPHRFSRNSLDSAILRKEFDALGVTVVFSTNPTSEVPSRADTNQLLATMADTLRTDMRDAYQKRRRPTNTAEGHMGISRP